MYAYFFTSDGWRVRVWQESVRGMPLLRLEAPVRLNQRRCRRIRRWLKRCGVHRLLNRPAHWPESEPLPPLIGTRELWITKAPETALALLAQAGVSPAQARVEFRRCPRALLLLPRVRGVLLAAPARSRTMYRLWQRKCRSEHMLLPCTAHICSAALAGAARDLPVPAHISRAGVPRGLSGGAAAGGAVGAGAHRNERNPHSGGFSLTYLYMQIIIFWIM